MAKGAKFRSIRRIIRLDKANNEIIEVPQMVKTGKFELIRNKETDKLERKFPLIQDSFKKNIFNKNTNGYRKVKKQFSESENFNKAFGGTIKCVEKLFYNKLNKEKSNEKQS